jgi:basic membrane protein A
MKKKVLSIVLAAATACSMLAGCGSTATGDTEASTSAAAATSEATATADSAADASASAAASDLKVGVILIGDEAVGYDKAHIDGIETAKTACGLSDDQVIYKKNVPESVDCYDAAVELIESQGCNVVVSDSYGHESFIDQAADEYPDVQFVSMTGDFAAISGKTNFANAFDNVYESRYVSGIVAGAKIKELADAGKLTDSNYDEDGKVKVGYVGAFNYAEVVSGYTAFYLGLTSVYPDAHMYVDYTNSWFDVDAEAAMAEKFISDGCVIVGQHADSTGAPSACQAAYDKGTTVFSIGYNVDMLDVAPDAALTSASNNWAIYYEYLFNTLLAGDKIDQDWSKGYNEDAVKITDLGPNCAEGTQDLVDTAISGLKDGSLQVFDTSKFTVSADNVATTLSKSGAAVTTDDAGHVTSCKIDMSFYDYSTGTPTLVYQGDTDEAIVDGAFEESTFRSAPYFTIRIDGITELN